MPGSPSRSSSSKTLHFGAAATSAGSSHSGRRPREERDDRNPALMQQHCSAAGWKRTQPRHGARGGTQTPNPRGKAQNPWGYGTEQIPKLHGVRSLEQGKRKPGRSDLLRQHKHSIQINIKDPGSLQRMTFRFLGNYGYELLKFSYFSTRSSTHSQPRPWGLCWIHVGGVQGSQSHHQDKNHNSLECRGLQG